MGAKDVPILFWTEVPQQGADEEDTGTYLYVPISIAPGAEANNLSQKDLCSAKIQKFQGGSPELYCHWRTDMQELFTARDCDDILDEEHVEQQLKLSKTTLTGPAMETFATALKHISRTDLCSAKIQRSPEQYCRWRTEMQELFTARDCDDLLDEEHVEQQLKLYSLDHHHRTRNGYIHNSVEARE
jgi:hypothetical protein